MFDNTNRGTLGKNLKRAADTHPEYSGQINIGGTDYWLSAWVKEGSTGKFFSLSVKPKEEKKPTKAEPKASFESDPDDIPF